MFASLEGMDFFWIWLIVFLVAGGSAAASIFKPADVARLRRLEAKLDLILKHLGLEYHGPESGAGLSAEVKALADQPSNKIAAIKLYREQTGLGLRDAKNAVEAYIAERG